MKNKVDDTQQVLMYERPVFATLTLEDAMKVINPEETITLVVPSHYFNKIKHPLCHTKLPIPAGPNDIYANLVNVLIESGCIPDPTSLDILKERECITLELANKLELAYNQLDPELR